MPNITPQDELIVREFYERIATRDDLFPGTANDPKILRGICLGLLGYVVVQGKIVKPEDIGAYTYGQRPEVKDRWEEDTEAARAAINDSDTPEAGTSEPSEDTEVR